RLCKTCAQGDHYAGRQGWRGRYERRPSLAEPRQQLTAEDARRRRTRRTEGTTASVCFVDRGPSTFTSFAGRRRLLRSQAGELRRVDGAEGRPLAVGLGEGVREPHHAARVAAVAEAEAVAELVDGLGRGAAGEDVLASRGPGTQPVEREDADAALGVALAE